MSAELVQTIGVPAVFAGLWLLERRRAARPFVAVKHWAAIGIGFFVLTAAVGSVVPLLLQATPLGGRSLLKLEGLGLWGAPIAFLVMSLVGYWWHRAEHRFQPLWVMSHQLHHSVRRVDVAGAFFVHPAEVTVKTTLSFLVSYFVLGVAPEAAVVAATLTTALSIFEHWNVRTPRWLGFFVARPEMHCLHHELGQHRRNYGLPLWDRLFGTYENPSLVEVQVGYSPEASARVLDMLRWRDVNR